MDRSGSGGQEAEIESNRSAEKKSRSRWQEGWSWPQHIVRRIRMAHRRALRKVRGRGR